MNALDVDHIFELEKLGRFLAVTNQRPTEYNFDENLCLRQGVVSNNKINHQVLQKIGKLFSLIVDANKQQKIKKETWDSLLANIKLFSDSRGLHESASLTELYIRPIQNVVYRTSFENIAVAYSKVPLSEFEESDMQKVKTFIVSMCSERRNVIDILFSQQFRLITLYCFKELANAGGKICVNAPGDTSLRLSWEDIEVETTEGALLALKLQKAFNSNKNSDLKNLLESYSKKSNTLSNEENKILHIWQLYYLIVYLQNVAQVVFIESFTAPNSGYTLHTKEKLPYFSFEIENFFKKEIVISQKDRDLNLHYEPTELFIQWFKQQLDEYNHFLCNFLTQKKDLDALYKNLYDKVEHITQMNAKQSSSKICDVLETQFSYMTPEEFSSLVIPKIAPNELEHFVTTDLFLHIPLFFAESEELPFQLIMNKYFGVDLQSRQYYAYTLALIHIVCKDRTINLPLLERQSAFALQEFQIHAALKINELEQLFDQQPEKKDQLDTLRALNEQLLRTDILDIASFFETLKNVDPSKNNLCRNLLSNHYNTYIGLQGYIYFLRKEKEPEHPVDRLCDDFIRDLHISPKARKKAGQVKRRNGRSRPHRKEEKEKEPEKNLTPTLNTNEFIPIPISAIMSASEIKCDARILDWFQKNPSALQTPSYSHLLPDEQKEQKRFHSYPLCIAKVARVRGEKSFWVSEKSKKKNPHFAIKGQIRRYKPGKEALFTGIFTECFDKDKNTLFHHHFIKRKFNISLNDCANKVIFSPQNELQNSEGLKKGCATKCNELFFDTKRFTLDQRPGLVIIDDKVKQIEYTLLIEET